MAVWGARVSEPCYGTKQEHGELVLCPVSSSPPGETVSPARASSRGCFLGLQIRRPEPPVAQRPLRSRSARARERYSPLRNDDESRSDRRGSRNNPRAIRPALRAGGTLPGHDIDRAIGLHDRKPFPLSGTDLQRVPVAETIKDRMLDTRSGSHCEKLDPRTNHEAAHNRCPTRGRRWGDCGSLLGHHRRGRGGGTAP